MNMGQAIKKRAAEVQAQLEKIPVDQRGPMHEYAVDAAKQAQKLALRNPMAAAVQLEDAQCEVPS
jgi:hypothetical protein